ncbi:MAG: DUF4364 family protein [Clostridiales bacterium]|nr:DUF4364 family protein [Clostridiales bacterium]
MAEESMTLYKLMILYMLDKADFPLTNSQLIEYFVGIGYIPYFHLQQSLNNLLDSSFIQKERIRNSTRYLITPAGQEGLKLFESKLSAGIKKDILNYCKDNNYRLRKEANIVADYYPDKNGEYMVDVCIKERDSLLLELKLNVVSKEQAIAVCDKWSEKSEEIYAQIIDNLLFDTDATMDDTVNTDAATETAK